MNGIDNITKRIADEGENTAREIIAAAEAEAKALEEKIQDVRLPGELR